MLVRLLVVLFSLAVLAPAWSDPPKDTPTGGTASRPAKKKGQPTTRKSRPKADKERKKDVPPNAALRAMKLQTEQAEFKDMPLVDFFEWLQRETKVNVVVRWKVLAKAGIPQEQPLTLRVEGVTIRKLLELVFAQVAGGDEKKQLSALAEDNTLIVSTRADINAQLVVRTYDVQDLLFTVPNFPGRSPGGAARPTERATVRGEAAAESDEARRLIEMITKNIEPASWKVNGGAGTIILFRGQLVIRNCAEVHQILAELLGKPGKKSSS